MIEVRCKNCNKLLAMADTINAAIKCNGCKQIFEYKIMSNLTMYNERDYIVTERSDAIPPNSGGN